MKILICLVLVLLIFSFLVFISTRENFVEEDFSNYYPYKYVPTYEQRVAEMKWQNKRAVYDGYKGSKCVKDCDCYPGLKCVYPQDTDSIFAQYSDLIPTSGICA